MTHDIKCAFLALVWLACVCGLVVLFIRAMLWLRAIADGCTP